MLSASSDASTVDDHVPRGAAIDSFADSRGNGESSTSLVVSLAYRRIGALFTCTSLHRVSDRNAIRSTALSAPSRALALLAMQRVSVSDCEAAAATAVATAVATATATRTTATSQGRSRCTSRVRSTCSAINSPPVLDGTRDKRGRCWYFHCLDGERLSASPRIREITGWPSRRRDTSQYPRII